jgi:hypothetical protein
MPGRTGGIRVAVSGRMGYMEVPTWIINLIESAAVTIGTSIDSTWEALMYVVYSAVAHTYACNISEYAQSVFHVLCEVN